MSANGTNDRGAGTISGAERDTRWLSHTGTEIGDSNVSLYQNAAGRESEVLSWTVPDKYTMFQYAAGKHITKGVFRYRQDVTGTANDDTVVSLDGNIRPVAGEPDVPDQPYPAVVAYNVTTDTEYDIADIDYGANEVTLATDPADGDTVALWPTINEGYIKYKGLNQFGHEVGPLDEWGVPLHVFSDYNQDWNKTQIHLIGAASLMEEEQLSVFVDSPRQIVWEDADYPRGQYASRLEQRVDIAV